MLCAKQAHPSLHEYLRHVEPLPAIPELCQAAALLDKLRAGVSLSAEMANFVGRAATLPAVLRRRALASLESGFATRQRELFSSTGCPLITPLP